MFTCKYLLMVYCESIIICFSVCKFHGLRVSLKPVMFNEIQNLNKDNHETVNIGTHDHQEIYSKPQRLASTVE